MIKLFSGTANYRLSQEVAKLLDISLSAAEVTRFHNSEVRVRIQEDVKNHVCVIIQPTANPTDTNLMELFFFCDALRRQEAKKVIGVIPYFGYARQDVQHRSGECVSANVIIRFIESIGFDKIYTIDLHDEATEGVFSIPFKNLSALPAVAGQIKKYLKNDAVAIVSPDQGGVERARKFGQYYFGKTNFDLNVIEKKRDLTHIHKSEAMALYGDIKNKTAILVDDLTTSGSTLINAAKLCLHKGAKKIVVAVVHHDFAPETEIKLQKSPIEKFFSTNTITLNKNFPKLEIVSVAPLIKTALESL